jgi:DNA-directed RNA polymerase subunit beta
MERVIRERMTLQDLDIVTPQSLINIRPVTAAIKEFFGSSPSAVHGPDEPLAELTHKRRMSALGPAASPASAPTSTSATCITATMAACAPSRRRKDPHRLISYLASYARVNEYGFLIAPFRRVSKPDCVVTDLIDYLTADQEDQFIIAQATEPVDEADGL